MSATIITGQTRETIAALVAGMTSEQMLAVWQDCLDEMRATPPNERHFECSAMIDVLAPLYGNLVEKEHDESVAQAAAVKAAAGAAATLKLKQGGPDIAKIIYDMRTAVWAATRAVGEDECARQCKRAILECVADNNVW